MSYATYSVKVSEEVKEKLQKLIDESGQSSKEFFADMISQFELLNARKQVPILSADIDELVKITTRINNIFVNVGERVASLQDTYQREAENEVKEKESLIRLLQQQIDTMKREAAETEEQATTNHNEKIDTLSGLVNQYKGYAEDNEILKNDLLEAQRAVEKLQQENERLSILLEDISKKQTEDIERQKEKFEIEKVKALLEQKEKHTHELDAVRDMYHEKINQLLQVGSKPKGETKKKVEPKKETP